jgi:hypothetical protein
VSGKVKGASFDDGIPSTSFAARYEAFDAPANFLRLLHECF